MLREAIVHLEQRMDQRFERLEDKMSTQFYWIAGIQITTLVAMIATILTAMLEK